MKKIKLTKILEFPERREERNTEEPILNKHEKWLRLLILHGFTPIYIGDKAEVSDRDSKNSHIGKTGEVITLNCGVEGALNIGCLSYLLKTDDGHFFRAPLYILDRIYQPSGNQLLEKLLRETNSELKAEYTLFKQKKLKIKG